MKFLKVCLLFSLQLVAAAFCVAQDQNPELASRIEQIMQARSADGDFNGTVLVARGGRVVYQRGFGLANMEWNTPNDVNTKFEIGSMTKQFTALLILQFVQEGKIRLEGHLSDYLSYYRTDTGSRVTISELLSHTSGVPNFTDAPGFLDGPASRIHHTVKEFVQDYCSGDLQFDPGTRFQYSNSGYFVLGAVLEQISGVPYEQLLTDRIFHGMKDSGYTHSESIIPHRAVGYERSASGLQNARYYDMSVPFAAGALYSTVEDLYRWDQALYGERLLPARLRNLLFRPNLEDYGYGWVMLVPSAGSPYAGESIPMHGGAIFGFQSLIQRIIQHRELIVLLDNHNSPKLLQIAQEIRQALASTLRAPGARTPDSKPSGRM
ncbi:MAG TPA: serine hydrolase domain-containing protein [Candidatus Angelobacter sp.]|jgi:CubicO group peptidase (beta-lactamase class C family)